MSYPTRLLSIIHLAKTAFSGQAFRCNMMNATLRLVVTTLLLTGAFLQPAGAGDGTAQPPSQTPYQLRRFEPGGVAAYLRDKDYAYDRGAGPASPDLWSRFWMWVYDKVFRRLFREGTEDYWRWGVYVVCAAIIGWAILRLTGVRSLFFGRTKGETMPFEENEANIHFIDFDRMIAEAVGQGQYRRAVRLFYLRTLKHLSDREIIEWRPNKTNHDYLREWKRPDIEPGFRQLTVLFEYICYGDFGIDQDRFEHTQRAFQDFEAQIGKASR
jgi:hypothetical protein